MYFRIVFLCFDNTTVKRCVLSKGLNENNDKTVEMPAYMKQKKDQFFDMG